jgi:hypothetical protein
MGSVFGGIPQDLTLRIRDASGAAVFIETGTFKGATSAWASGHFEKVFTVEIAPDMHTAAAQRLSGFKNVRCLLGDSRKVLAEILPSLGNQRAVIWLDAHACGEEDRDSPLLQEIDLINRLAPDSSILIDDARFVLLPQAGRRLCSLDGLVRMLDCGRFNRELVVLQDVIVAVPRSAKEVVEAYCREVTLAEWESSQVRLRWRTSVRGRILNRLQKLVKAPPDGRP